MYTVKSVNSNLLYTEKPVFTPSKDCVVSMVVENKTSISAYVSFKLTKDLYRHIPVGAWSKITLPEFVVKKNATLYGSTDFFTSGNVDCILNVSELN